MRSTFLSPLDTPDVARKAVRQAATAGFVSAAITLAFLLYARWAEVAPFGGLLSLWSLLDVAVGVALSYGTLRGNRFAAVGLLGFYVLNQVVARVSSDAVGGFMLTLVFVAFLAQGVRGAFVLHRMQQEDPLDAQVQALAAEPAEAP